MDAALFFLLGNSGLAGAAVPRTLKPHPHLSPPPARANRPALPSNHRRRLRFSASPPEASAAVATPHCSRWVVVVDKPPAAELSRAEAVDYYVGTLARVLGSEEEAQMRIYDASWEGNYGFCCEIDEAASRELARLPGVLAVRPVKDEESKMDYRNLGVSVANCMSSNDSSSNVSSSSGKNEFWLVRMEKPGVEVVTKAQMVDHYTQILAKVLGNEQDAQVCIYHISWERNFGFCCQIDEECAQELADVPGVLSVHPDENFGSDNKDYKGDDSLKSQEATQLPDVKTKRLFVTGLSFYTSEKTLRAAFEPFGELVQVKIIMDKISKRSKGYAFIEYTTEEAAGAAMKEMNGKIINGWMIVVDVARTSPRDRRRPTNASTASSY